MSFSESPVVSLFLSLMLLALICGKNRLFGVCALIAGLARMDMLVVFPFFSAALFFTGRKKYAAGVLAGAIILFFAEVFWLIPMNTGTHMMSAYTIEKYSQFGKSVTEIAFTVFRHPLDTAAYIFTKDRMIYFFQMFAVMFPGFFSPFIIPALAKFGLNVLSNMPLQHSIYYAYNSDVIVFGMFAVIDGLRRLKQKNSGAGIVPALYALSLGSCICFSNSFFSLSFWLPEYGEKNGMLRYAIQPLFKFSSSNHEIWEIAALMPPDCSVMTTADIAVAFAQRKYCYLYSEGKIDERKPDYIVVKFAGYFYSIKEKKPVICSYPLIHDAQFKNLYVSQQYTPVFQNDVCVVFERKSQTHAEK